MQRLSKLLASDEKSAFASEVSPMGVWRQKEKPERSFSLEDNYWNPMKAFFHWCIIALVCVDEGIGWSYYRLIRLNLTQLLKRSGYLSYTKEGGKEFQVRLFSFLSIIHVCLTMFKEDLTHIPIILSKHFS